MSVVTDLTWSQLNTALQQLLGTNTSLINANENGVTVITLNINPIISGTEVDGLSALGVIKFITRLHDACRIAQEAANQGKTTGEKLSAFGAATAAAPRGTLVPITRAMVTQADLSTATKIVGTNV